MTDLPSNPMTSADIIANEKFVWSQFPLLAAMASHNGNELQNEIMALLAMATNLRLEALHPETSPEPSMLEAAWRKYGRHSHDCQRYGVHQCTCGFVETCLAMGDAEMRSAVKTSCTDSASPALVPDPVHLSGSGAGGVVSHRQPVDKPPQLITGKPECPTCRTELAFEGDVCGLCE